MSTKKNITIYLFCAFVLGTIMYASYGCNQKSPNEWVANLHPFYGSLVPVIIIGIVALFAWGLYNPNEKGLYDDYDLTDPRNKNSGFTTKK